MLTRETIPCTVELSVAHRINKSGKGKRKKKRKKRKSNGTIAFLMNCRRIREYIFGVHASPCRIDDTRNEKILNHDEKVRGSSRGCRKMDENTGLANINEM